MATLKPTPKVAAGTTAGAASIVLVWALSLVGVDMPEYVAASIAVLLTAGAAYLKSDGRHVAGD